MGLEEPRLQESPKGTIDVKKQWPVYNKDFDLSLPAHFKALQELCPTHLTEAEWGFQIAELKLMLESDEKMTEDDKASVILGWKFKNGLFPPEENE